MKYTFLLVFLVFGFFAKGQTGYDYIRKAEKKIESGRLNKALQLLEKADSADYGFCGNSWASAYDAIAVKKAEIFKLQDDSIKAAKAIWNVGGYFVFNQHDSLKVSCLINAYGTEKVKIGIDRAIDSLTGLDSFPVRWERFAVYFDFTEEPFEISSRVAMDDYHWKQIHLNSYEENLTLFGEALREQPFYQLLLETDQSKN